MENILHIIPFNPIGFLNQGSLSSFKTTNLANGSQLKASATIYIYILCESPLYQEHDLIMGLVQKGVHPEHLHSGELGYTSYISALLQNVAHQPLSHTMLEAGVVDLR